MYDKIVVDENGVQNMIISREREGYASEREIGDIDIYEIWIISLAHRTLYSTTAIPFGLRTTSC